MRRILIALALALVALPIGAAATSQVVSAATCRPALSTFAVQARVLVGGSTTRATVTLGCAASSAVTIRVVGTTGLKTPATVRIPAARRSVTFVVRTESTKRRTAGSLEVRLGTTRRRVSLTRVTAPTCGLALKVPVLHAGDSVRATVTLACKAPGSLDVAIGSTDSRVQVPSSVTIHRGAPAASFTVRIRLPSPSAYEGSYRATLRADDHRRATSRQLSVTPGLRSVQVQDPDGLLRLAVGLTGAAAQGTDAVVTTNSPLLQFPNHTTLGGQTTHVSPSHLGAVSTDARITVSVRLGTRTLSTTTTIHRYFNATDPVSITDEGDGGPLIYFGPMSNRAIEASFVHPLGPNETTAHFSTDLPQVSIAPETDTYAGATSVDTLIDAQPVASPTSGHITVTIGSNRTTVPITLEPGVISLSGPEPIWTGVDTPVTISLSGVTDVDERVYLQEDSGYPDVAYPDEVTIPAGASSTTIDVRSDSNEAGFDAWFEISANHSDQSLRAPLHFSAADGATLQLDDPLLYGDSSGTATVQLARVSTTDTLVTLGSSDPRVVVPPSIAVPAGSIVATVPITVAHQDVDGYNVTLTATLNGGVSHVYTHVMPALAAATIDPVTVSDVPELHIRFSGAIPASVQPAVTVTTDSNLLTYSKVVVYDDAGEGFADATMTPPETPTLVTVTVAYGPQTAQIPVTLEPDGSWSVQNP